MLSFRLLGQVALCRDGEPLEQFRSQKEAALLIYLAQTGQSQPRDVIAELLWEDRSVQQMRSNLRTALSRLRGQVGDDLTATRTSLALSPDSLADVDSVQLLRALADFGPVDSPEQARALLTILDAYTGDFLADFYLSDAPRFAQWAVTVREEIRRQVLSAFHSLGRYAQNASDGELGLAIARRWLEVDRLEEEAHILLIRLLLRAGDRRGAAAHYEQSVALLRDELDVEPSPALTGLMRDSLPAPSLPSPSSSPPQQPRHNLPPAYDQFFGRVRAREEIHSRLDQPWCRLVTIVGQGGVGKTRLATTIARDRLARYADGVWLVELADIDPEDDDLAEAIAIEIATAIDLRLSGAATPEEQLLTHLQYKQALLVLDNFEHILGGLPMVLELLQRCEAVQLLATSREPLHIRAEWTIDLTGLDYPDSDADGSDSEAVQLFLARRAQQQRQPISAGDLAAARAICRMVQGLPLAVELAAALTRHASSRAIAQELSHDFDRLATSLRDVPERHSSLHVVFEMSWRTLSPELQTRLARLATFRGGFTAEAARQVAQADARHLAGLQEKSLLGYEPATDRYALHPVVRAYAAAKRPDDDPAPRQHAEYFLGLLATHAQPLRGSAPQECVALLLPDLDNVRLAWQTALAARMVPLLLPALPALSSVYQLRGLAREGAEVMQATVLAAGEWGSAGDRLAVRAGLEQTRFQNRLGRYRPALETVQTALALAQSSRDHWAEGMGYILWGESLWRLGEYDTARQKLLHALALAESLVSAEAGSADATLLVGWCHHHLGVIDDFQGHYTGAQHHLQQACDAWRAIGYAMALSSSLSSSGVVHYHQGDLSFAQERMEQALALSVQLDDRQFRSVLLNNLSMIATEQGNYTNAERYLRLGLELAEMNSDPYGQALLHTNIGRNYRFLGEDGPALQSLQRGLQMAEAIGNRSVMSIALFHQAEIASKQAAPGQAEGLYRRALELARQDRAQSVECEVLIGLAQLLGRRNDREAAEYSAQAVALAAQLQNPPLQERAQATAEAVERWANDREDAAGEKH